MGNRAHVIFTNDSGSDISPAVYLHWNGGPESVYRFLEETERRMQGRFGDTSYSAARFAQAVGDFFDSGEQGGLSLGVVNGPPSLSLEDLEPYNHGDNGVYAVSPSGVRRFVEPLYHSGLRELSPAEVTAEQEEAERSDYAPELRAYFDGIRPSKAEEVNE